MSKRILVSLLAVLMGVSAISAQMFEPVKWKTSSKKIDDKTVELTFTATIEKGWHLYSMQIAGEDGPQPTTFNFETKQGAKFQGGVVAKSKLTEEYDQMFEMTVGYYSNTAIFTQK